MLNIQLKKQMIYSVMVLTVFLLCLGFVNSEDSIYYWDYAFYWFSSNWIADGYVNLKHFFIVLRNDDYNFTSVLLQSAFSYITSTARNIFILTTVVFYFFPFCFVFLNLFGEFVKEEKTKMLVFSLIISATPFIKPILIGYPDIVGLIFVLLSIILCLKKDLSKIDVKNIVLLGILLYLPFMFRRWFAYTIVSLFLTLPLLNYFIFERKKDINKFRCFFTILCSFFMSGLVSMFCAFSLQWGLCRRILGTNYSDIYSAYRLPLRESLCFVIDSVGLWIVPLVVSAICMLFKKNYIREKVLIVFSLANFFIILFLFFSTQSPGIQHQQPLALFIYIISSLGLINIVNANGKLGVILLTFPIVFISMPVFSLFHRMLPPAIYDSISYSRHNLLGNDVIILPICNYDNPEFNIKKNIYLRDGRMCTNGENLLSIFPLGHTPMRSENLDNYRKLLDFFTTNVQPSEKAYFLSSSEVFNGTMLMSLGGLSKCEKFSSEQHVDFRDGPPFSLLKADYVIVASPVQTHLKKGQYDIILPAYSFIKKTDIYRSYQEIPIDINLSRFGELVTIRIFKKVKPFNSEDLQLFFDKFYEVYPEWKKSHGDDISWAIAHFQ